MNRSHLLIPLACVLFTGCVVELKPQEVVAETDVTVSLDQAPVDGFVINCPLPSGCRTAGICVGTVSEPVCNEDGTWDCGYETVTDFEADEVTCDGLDNDCDGTTDEDLDRPADPACGESGVCAAGVSSRCDGAEWVCEFAKLPNWEATETACDGLDNDCNGEIDANLVGSPANCEKNQGVCSGAQVVCDLGQWTCDYGPFYVKGDNEFQCDQLDNNCDGVVDNVTPKLEFSDCPTVGACLPNNDAGAQTVQCTEGHWDCNSMFMATDLDGQPYYPDYQGVEIACDGVDNDCDGQTDEDIPGLTTNDCINPNKDNGICNQQGAPVCQGGKVWCLFDGIQGYEPNETLCDGLDNDCDGQTDAGLSTNEPPLSAGCKSLGECAYGSSATCDNGMWQCHYSDTVEVVEMTCDGKDNDCDGVVDEDVFGDSADCSGFDKGVCTGAVIAATCFNGAFMCNFSDVPKYEAGNETSCDNLDNDCDGLVDEDLHDVQDSDCSLLGICSTPSKVTATCDKGSWSCDYGLLEGMAYEGVTETLCDGVDNDCDGLVDEGIVDPLGGNCKTDGVCESTVLATCVGGTYACDYTVVVGYENPEVSCDGLDNNCDGNIDESVCPDLYPCESHAQCQSQYCVKGPTTDQQFCVSKGSMCPSDGGVKLYSLGEQGCVQITNSLGNTDWFLTTCSANGWEHDTEPCESGACYDGQCTTCMPNTSYCSASGQATVTCSEDGAQLNTLPCPLGTSCDVSGRGVCLQLGEFSIEIAGGVASKNVHSAVDIGPDGNFVVSWQTDAQPMFGQMVAGLEFDSLATSAPGTSMFTPLTDIYENQGQPDVVVLDGKNAALVFQNVSDDDAGDVKLRVHDYALNKPVSALITVNQTTDFEQSNPSLARSTQGNLLIGWESLATGDGNGFDIFVRAYSLNGDAVPSAVSDEIRVNTHITGRQEMSKVEALDNGTFVVGWDDENEQGLNNYGVLARIVDANGQMSGEPFLISNDNAGDQKHLALAAVPGGGFVATWTSTLPAGTADVMVQRFTSSGERVYENDVFVTSAQTQTSQPGVQHHADVAVAFNGQVAVAWDAPSGDSEGSGAVFFQTLNADLTPHGTPMKVNETLVIGDQRRPKIVTSKTENKPWAFVVFESTGLSPEVVSIVARPFELK